MGSRFGGLKQAAKFGKSQKVILDFALEDAMKAGFDSVVFVIRSDIEKVFREDVSRKYENLLDVKYVFQDRAAKLPEGRTKPWGTGHAILACGDLVDTPFLAINADDYYGSGVYLDSAKFAESSAENLCALAGYRVRNTLSKNGGVSRGVCEADGNMNLKSIREYTDIKTCDDGTIKSADGRIFDGNEFVSLNFWTFHKAFFEILGEYFDDFMSANSRDMKAEFYLPASVDKAISQKRLSARILPTNEVWQGVTYKADMPHVEAFLAENGRI